MNAPVLSPPSPVRSISPAALRALLRDGRPCAVLDVRTPAEFDSAHLPGAHALPLNELSPAALQKLALAPDAPLYLLCQSGGRARRAADQLAAAGVPGCTVVEGGLDACISAGLPVERGASPVLPLMRQVQIVIGLVSGIGAALAVWKDPLFALVPLFTGTGLLFAGLTGTCGLALLRARMPWNQRGSKPAATSCCSGGAQ